ncbi:aldo/keto reductase [Haliangium sp.]|uniref:aldo/keto reductase n=1 Tax=Haliangium sp. TaxID=2663208 RepID=UPI003D0E83A1
MQYTNLGPTGLIVSRICLGCMTYGTPTWREWVLDEAASRPFFERALELGINFFDTADMYSAGVSEEVTGRALGELAKRDEIVIASKVYFPTGPGKNQRGLSRKHIMHAIDGTLKRLGTDYVDLYQIHRFDPNTPIEETMEALHDVVKAGKALHIGASSMWAWQFAKAQAVAERNGWTRFSSMQNYYNLVYREEEREMLPMCADQGLAVLPWSPLARGFLARSGDPEATQTARSRSEGQISEWLQLGQENDLVIRTRVGEIAAARGVSNAQVATAWLLSRPAVTAPIIGARKLEHLDDAVAALEVELDDEEISRLEAPYQPHEVVGHQ